MHFIGTGVADKIDTNVVKHYKNEIANWLEGEKRFYLKEPIIDNVYPITYNYLKAIESDLISCIVGWHMRGDYFNISGSRWNRFSQFKMSCPIMPLLWRLSVVNKCFVSHYDFAHIVKALGITSSSSKYTLDECILAKTYSIHTSWMREGISSKEAYESDSTISIFKDDWRDLKTGVDLIVRLGQKQAKWGIKHKGDSSDFFDVQHKNEKADKEMIPLIAPQTSRNGFHKIPRAEIAKQIDNLHKQVDLTTPEE